MQPTSVLRTDQGSPYHILAANNPLDWGQLKGGKVRHSKFLIQNASELYQFIKGFLEPLHGVATKYTHNYVVWHKGCQFRIGDLLPLRDAEEAIMLHSVRWKMDDGRWTMDDGRWTRSLLAGLFRSHQRVRLTHCRR